MIKNALQNEYEWCTQDVQVLIAAHNVDGDIHLIGWASLMFLDRSYGVWISDFTFDPGWVFVEKALK